MGVNAHKIVKWINMLRGNSVYHVNQGIGQVYSKDAIAGYYNDFTEKVTRFGKSGATIPKTVLDNGEEVYFPIAIFQYGLGAYDLFLINKDKENLEKVMACAHWAVENQQNDGAWMAFSSEFPNAPYSAMAQGEAISLLARAYLETADSTFFEAAKKAYTFLCTPIEQGGTTKIDNEQVYLLEYTSEPLVLNGWIFALWGVLDYYKLTNDNKALCFYKKSLSTLSDSIQTFDLGYWSRYDESKRIASPFYHRLHISQLKVMYVLTNDIRFLDYATKFEKYSEKFVYKLRAFIKKSIEKIRE